jgi:hypothetical protein
MIYTINLFFLLYFKKKNTLNILKKNKIKLRKKK